MSSGSSGTYSLSETGQLSNNYEEVVGYSGVGTFTQSGGTNTASHSLILSAGTPAAAEPTASTAER